MFLKINHVTVRTFLIGFFLLHGSICLSDEIIFNELTREETTRNFYQAISSITTHVRQKDTLVLNLVKDENQVSNKPSSQTLKVKLTKILGNGDTTLVLGVSVQDPETRAFFQKKGVDMAQLDHLAIRLPLEFPRETIGNGWATFFEIQKEYLNGYHLLQKNGVPIIKVYSNISYEGLFTFTDQVLEFTDAASWLKNSRENPFRNESTAFKNFGFAANLYGAKREAALQTIREKLALQFVDFAKELKHFEKIGDFNPKQIIYDLNSMRWILLDWTNDPKLWSAPFDARPHKISFLHPFKKFDDKYQEALKAIRVKITAGERVVERSLWDEITVQINQARAQLPDLSAEVRQHLLNGGKIIAGNEPKSLAATIMNNLLNCFKKH